MNKIVLFDFGMQYHSCIIPELLDRLQSLVSSHRLSLTIPQQLNGKARQRNREQTMNPAGEEEKDTGHLRMPHHVTLPLSNTSSAEDPPSICYTPGAGRCGMQEVKLPSTE